MGWGGGGKGPAPAPAPRSGEKLFSGAGEAAGWWGGGEGAPGHTREGTSVTEWL